MGGCVTNRAILQYLRDYWEMRDLEIGERWKEKHCRVLLKVEGEEPLDGKGFYQGDGVGFGLGIRDWIWNNLE